MAQYKTISARVPEEMKKKLDKYHVNVSDLIRKAIEDEISRRERKDLGKALQGLQKKINKVSPEEITKMIREDRDSQ